MTMLREGVNRDDVLPPRVAMNIRLICCMDNYWACSFCIIFCNNFVCVCYYFLQDVITVNYMAGSRMIGGVCKQYGLPFHSLRR